MDKKNVLLISQSLSIGGAERVLANLSLQLAKDYNVYIVTYSKDSKEYTYAGQRINIDCKGGDVSYIQKIKNFFVRLKKIKFIKKNYNIDISISFVPQTDYINVFTKRNDKVIIEVSSNSSIAFNKSRVSRLIRKYILRKADKVVAVSKGSMEDLKQNFNVSSKKLSVIYNSCDLDRIKIMSENAGEKKNTIIAVGSFRKPKGHWHLIKAFSLIANKYPELKLQILGDGEYRKLYDELIHNLKIKKDRIEFPGYQTNPYIFMKEAKIFVFSSIYEGFGNVIIESMACGTPVISTDCNYGPREIIAPTTPFYKKCSELEMAQYGCIVPHMGDGDIDITSNITDQERELAKAIDMYLSDDNLTKKYIESGYERSYEFDIKKFGDKWKCLIEQMN